MSKATTTKAHTKVEADLTATQYKKVMSLVKKRKTTKAHIVRDAVKAYVG